MVMMITIIHACTYIRSNHHHHQVVHESSHLVSRLNLSMLPIRVLGGSYTEETRCMKSGSQNWKLWFYLKMPLFWLGGHTVTWNDCFATVVTRNWARRFPSTLVSLWTLPWRYVLKSNILNNGQRRCPTQSEARLLNYWCSFSSTFAQL
jgi:hypothetical protein